MRKSVIRIVSVLAAAFILPLVTGAPEAAAISLSKRMPDGKLCRVMFGDPHIHAANGAKPDKTEAQIKAIHDWARFTAFEYGRRWADWRYAVHHAMTCVHDPDAGVWRCRAEAQPCKNESREEIESAYRSTATSTGCNSLLSLSCIQRIVQSTLVWQRY